MDSIDNVILIAKREGLYTNYVFKSNTTYQYLMCTRLPNWQEPNLNINDEGYLQYKVINAGDKYFDPTTSTLKECKYSGTYFIKFIPKSNIKDNKIIL